MTNAVALAIKITTDAKGASAGIDSVTSKTSKLGTAGKLAGRALAAGLGLAVVGGVKAAQAAAADEQAQVKLANAIKNATGARGADVAKVEDWISAQGKALGVADDQLRPALENLVTATHDVGKAQQLATIAMDVSARKGISLESVSKSLAKAQATGNVAALAKYGVATKDAAGKALSLEQVTKNLANTYKGSAAASADTAAGKQKRLQVAMGELQEEIGAKLLPVLLKLSGAGLKVVDWISKNQAAAAAIIGTIAGLLAIVKLVSLATTLYSTYLKIAAASQAIFNAVMAANPIILVVVAVVALAAALVIAYKRSETFRNIVNKAFGAIARTVGAVVGFIRNHWKTMLAILAGPIGLAVLLIVRHRDKILAAFTVARTWITEKWKAVKDALAGPIQKARELIGTAVGNVKDGIVSVKTKAEEIRDKISSALSTAFQPFKDAYTWVKDLISKIGDLIAKLKDLPGAGALGALADAVTRTSAGTPGGSGPRGGGLLPPKGSTAREVHVHLHMPDRTIMVGSERQIAREFVRLIGNEKRLLQAVGG
jgi:phage-related protein